ncbi:MAG TPA: class I SAM-dependent methyltransferase [Mycobacteriales bacterium]|nr:class I SAM-dependent methyltransferase [Mycobacteriales bacterium]
MALPWLYRAIGDRVVADLPSGGHLLDVGSGPGRLLVTLARRRPDAQLAGIDPSESMVQRARERIGAAGIADRVDVTVAPSEALPFANGTFDVIVSSLSAHHWDNIPQGVSEQARVLRPGGHLWVFDLRRRQSDVAAALRTEFGGAAVTQPRLGLLRDRLVICLRAAATPAA